VPEDEAAWLAGQLEEARDLGIAACPGARAGDDPARAPQAHAAAGEWIAELPPG
jgi:hypothetical protein